MNNDSLIQITPEEGKQVRKLHAAYDRAEGALAAKRDELFPPGCRVKSNVWGMETTVLAGSLYEVDPKHWTKKGHSLAIPDPVVMTAILHA